VDIGSGAGFPGIPIKIACPHLEVTLIEASRKKSSFLRHILILLRLSRIECLRIRAEDLTEDARYQGRFDLAVARAAGPRENLYRVAAPLLRTRDRKSTRLNSSHDV
jgi:16S rRNA (guanine527-N7)-methyltransferase